MQRTEQTEAITVDNITKGIVARQRTRSLVKELFRKSIHICSAFVPFFLKLNFKATVIFFVVVLFGYILSEILRLNGISLPLIAKITETAARKRDENRFVLGPVTLVTGIFIAVFVLPLEYARIGIFALSFGDGLASLAGKMIGKITIPGSHGKTVAGSLTCFTAVYIATFICTGYAAKSFVIALSAMIIEMLPLADLDNVIIPVAIGLIASLIIP